METLVQEAPPAPADPKRPKVDADALFDKVGAYFAAIPATRALDYDIALDDLGLSEAETAYLATVLRNSKRDELRQDRVWRKHFRSLDALLEDARIAKEEGEAPEFIEPPGPAQAPDIELERSDFQARFRAALLELPIELAVIAYALPLFNGNVSALARELGQPQRRTARQVVRIQKHLAAKGLSV